MLVTFAASFQHAICSLILGCILWINVFTMHTIFRHAVITTWMCSGAVFSISPYIYICICVSFSCFFLFSSFYPFSDYITMVCWLVGCSHGFELKESKNVKFMRWTVVWARSISQFLLVIRAMWMKRTTTYVPPYGLQTKLRFIA